MATSRTTGGALGYLESRKNLTGCVCGLAGLGLTLAGQAGTFWPLVVGGLYGAGALLAPPEREAPPPFSETSELAAVRADFAALRPYLDAFDAPPAAAGSLAELDGLLTALLDPGWVADELVVDPEAVHALARAVRHDVPEAIDAYQRTRWWSRLTPGGEPPERHLERQLALIGRELTARAATIRESQEARQQTHTTDLEGRDPREP
ncbi:hypothetical protein [Streptomyces hainanensis]|uniref:Uncharacterized protein n=1 Tax=Streptomyces hainanensis TaxID=402648 RepID=A0A4R4STY3_9ACTN|nr:hypothetical protein [Streptomyces hainanensis]TDC67580.1 hypothetical protein E1283_28660 [Streptomyces hainanensis]